jgi:hypothetical protein
MSRNYYADADMVLKNFGNNIKSLISTDFNKANDEEGKYTRIYHYTDVKGALGILQSGELWFTERAHLNDPTEICYGLSIACELFETAAQNSGATIPKDVASRLKGGHKLLLETHGFWIFSGSLDGNNLGQWRNYADDGRGVCLGFSLEHFNMKKIARHIPYGPDGPDSNLSASVRFRVNYNKDDLLTNLQPYIDISLEILANNNLVTQDIYYERFFRILNDGFYVNSILSKHPAYCHEQEYRLLISGIRNTFSACDRHCLRERNSEIVGYLKLPVPMWKEPGVLTHVRLGPAAPDQLQDQLRMTLTTLGIPLPTIEKSGIPYRSTRCSSECNT